MVANKTEKILFNSKKKISLLKNKKKTIQYIYFWGLNRNRCLYRNKKHLRVEWKADYSPVHPPKWYRRVQKGQQLDRKYSDRAVLLLLAYIRTIQMDLQLGYHLQTLCQFVWIYLASWDWARWRSVDFSDLSLCFLLIFDLVTLSDSCLMALFLRTVTLLSWAH